MIKTGHIRPIKPSYPTQHGTTVRWGSRVTELCLRIKKKYDRKPPLRRVPLVKYWGRNLFGGRTLDDQRYVLLSRTTRQRLGVNLRS